MKIVKLLFTVGLVFMFALSSGCAPKETKEEKQTEGEASTAEQWNTNEIVTMDWKVSGHTQVYTSPAEREGCVDCHAGNGFAKEGVKPEELDKKESITCNACHSERGIAIMDAGKVTIAAGEVNAGKGSLCVHCHNTRRKGEAGDKERSGPHYGTQGNVVSAIGGVELEGVEYTHKAHGVQGNCVSCHMSKADEGPANHTMTVGIDACQGCHPNVLQFNGKAGADYDGDGNIGGIQDEVKGLMAKVHDAIVTKTGATRIEYVKGKVALFDKSGTQIENMDDNVYGAAYNYLMIKQDGSYGVHNPWYAVQLLQNSYKAVAGKELANSKPYGG